MAEIYEGRTIFRRGSAAIWVVAGATALFAVMTAVSYAVRGADWVSIVLGVVTVVFGGGGLLEAFIERVELKPDAMVVTRLTGTRRYSIADIDRIEEARGSPPAVRLTNGQWVHLPDCTAHFGNSARAWLKANQRSSPGS